MWKRRYNVSIFHVTSRWSCMTSGVCHSHSMSAPCRIFVLISSENLDITFLICHVNSQYQVILQPTAGYNPATFLRKGLLSKQDIFRKVPALKSATILNIKFPRDNAFQNFQNINRKASYSSRYHVYFSCEIKYFHEHI